MRPPARTAPDGAPKPANAPPGSEGDEGEPGLTVAPPGSTPDPQPRGSGRASGCEPWRDLIRAKCDLGLTAQRIYQDLVADHGFAGSYYSVRRFVRRLEEAHDLPFRRIECDPGDEAQVDFGTGAPVVGPDGKRRKTHVLRVVLSHSRKGYSEAVYRQTTDDFLRCLEDAFRHFGGVPRRLVLDNLKAAVKKADWFDPELNPKVRSFGEHYGTVFLPTRPYTPRHKGKVERGVDYVQENALRGRSFASLEEQNRFLRDWELTVADTRVHGTTRRHVGKHFAEVERAALLPLPVGAVPVVPRGPPHGAPRRPRRGRARLLLGAAGVPRPPGLGPLGRAGWCGSSTTGWSRSRSTSSTSRGGSARSRSHIASEKISGVERGAAWHLARVRRLGPHSTRWAEAVVAGAGRRGGPGPDRPVEPGRAAPRRRDRAGVRDRVESTARTACGRSAP